jgi:hypothetical protein
MGTALTMNSLAEALSNPSDPEAFEGRAVVFDGPEDFHAPIDDPALDLDDDAVLVIRGVGPIGGVSILGGRGHYLGTVAGAISLVALISLLRAENMPEYGRSIVYGVAILVVLILFGREEPT